MTNARADADFDRQSLSSATNSGSGGVGRLARSSSFRIRSDAREAAAISAEFTLSATMVTFDVEVEIPMDAEAYLREKDSQAYKDFHMRKMGTLEQEYLSHEVVDGHVVTVTRTVPSINIPWALRRAILGNKQAEFIDRRRWMEGSHLTAPFTQSFHTTNNITDRCVVEGTITVEPAGAAGACRVRAQGECVVTLKGFGPKVESLIVANLRGSYEKLPEVMEEWMRVKRLDDAAASSFVSNLSPAAPHRARRRGGAFGSFIDVESAADVVAFDDEDEDVDAKSRR